GYVALAKSYALTGETELCAATFEKAKAIAPNDASVWFDQGACLARAKDWDAAIDCMTRAVQMDPSNRPYCKYLGLTLARSGRYEEAFTALARCMPEAEARFTLARMLQHNQHAVAAEQQLRLALMADANYIPAREMLAELTGGGAAAGASGVRTARY